MSRNNTLPKADHAVPGRLAWARHSQPMPPPPGSLAVDPPANDAAPPPAEQRRPQLKVTEPQLTRPPMEKAPLANAVKNMTRGERVIAFIEEFCKVPEGKDVGKPIRLDHFQKLFILDVYDNAKALTHTAILCMARKNGKTVLISCLVIVHTCGPEAQLNSQIISGAMSRDQASIVFKMAAKMIMLDKRLRAVCRIVPSLKQIIGLAKNVEYRAISAEATTALGLSPIVAILDEIGQIVGPVSAFVEAVTTSQGAHANPLLFAISTSAASDADLLSLWIDDALRGHDPGIVVHEYRAPENCDLMDQEAWKAANPGLGTIRSIVDLQKQCSKAQRLPALENGVRNLLLNQRVALVSKWLAPTPWKACSRKPDIDVFRGGYVVSCGLDLSSRLDLTAAVFSATDEGGYTHMLVYAFTPTEGLRERAERDRAPYEQWVKDGWLIATPGRSVDYDWVAEFLARECQAVGITINLLAFDRWRIDQFRKAADAHGFAQEAEWKEVGQGYKDSTPRMISFEAQVLNGKLRHGAHPVLNMAAANAIVTLDPAGNKKLDKAKATQRIDPLAAAVMSAFEVAEGVGAEVDLAGMIG